MRWCIDNKFKMDSTCVKIHNLWKKKERHINEKLTDRVNQLCMTNRIKLYSSHLQDNGRRVCFSLKFGSSVHKLLSSVVLPMFLFFYILKGYGNNIQEEKSFITYKLTEEKIFILKQITTKIKNRILTEYDKNKEVTQENKVFSFKHKNKWNPDLSEHIMNQHREYKDMLLKLKCRIFLNYLEYDTCVNRMLEKKKIIERHAPQLLDPNESEYIEKAKILQFYTQYPNRNSKISRLTESLYHYSQMFKHFKNEWLARNEYDKEENRQKGKAYSIYLRNMDTDLHMVIHKRLEKVKEQIGGCMYIECIRRIHKENMIITNAIRLSRQYLEILKKIKKKGDFYDSADILALYRIEKLLDYNLSELFWFVKWKKEYAL